MTDNRTEHQRRLDTAREHLADLQADAEHHHQLVGEHLERHQDRMAHQPEPEAGTAAA